MKTTKLLSIVSILSLLFSVTACNKKKRVEIRKVTETKTVTKPLKNPENASMQKEIEELKQELASRDAKNEQERKDRENLMLFLERNHDLIGSTITLDKNFLNKQVVDIQTYLLLQESQILTGVSPKEYISDYSKAVALAQKLSKNIKQISYFSEDVKKVKKSYKLAMAKHKKYREIFTIDIRPFERASLRYSFYKKVYTDAKARFEKAHSTLKKLVTKEEYVKGHATFKYIIEATKKNILDNQDFEKGYSTEHSWAQEIEKSLSSVQKAELDLLRTQLKVLLKHQITFEANFKAKALDKLPNILKARHQVATRFAKGFKKARVVAENVTKGLPKKMAIKVPKGFFTKKSLLGVWSQVSDTTIKGWDLIKEGHQTLFNADGKGEKKLKEISNKIAAVKKTLFDKVKEEISIIQLKEIQKAFTEIHLNGLIIANRAFINAARKSQLDYNLKAMKLRSHLQKTGSDLIKKVEDNAIIVDLKKGFEFISNELWFKK